MYWTGEYYKPTSCNDPIEGKIVIALDTSKVAHLKKITRRDTLTQNSIGKVAYTKVYADSVDFYTMTGDHPLDNNKRLLPMSAYIFKKYILDKKKVKK